MIIKKIKKNFKLETKRFIIKPILLQDVNKNYLSWFRKNTFYIQDSLNKKISLSYLTKYVKKNLKKNNTIFLAIFNKKRKHIGNIKFHEIDLKKKISNLGIWIGDKNYLNKGAAKETLSGSIKFFFDNNYIKKFFLGVASDNTPAIKLYKKLGFKIISRIDSKTYGTILNMTLLKKNFGNV